MHFFQCIQVSFLVYICDAVLKQMHFESCLEKVFAGVPDAIFCGDSAYVSICSVKKLKYFT